MSIFVETMDARHFNSRISGRRSKNPEPRQNGRIGATRFDVIVILALAVFAISFLAPAVNNGRGSRRLQCLSNIRQLGLAVQAYAASTGSLPSLASTLPISNQAGQEGAMNVGWPITLLPALDAAAVWRNIKRNAQFGTGKTDKSMMVLAESERIWLEVFTCPQDPDSFRRPGGLSYVVNAGFMPRRLYQGDPDGLHRLGLLSWNGNSIIDEVEDIEIAAATGVFWRPCEAFTPTFDSIIQGDGQSVTIMLTENLHAGNWYDTDTAKIAFGLPVADDGGQVRFGEGKFFESTSRPLNTDFPGGTLVTATDQDWRINTEKKPVQMVRPSPSSNHTGGVNVIMCDGSGRFLSDKIDPHLYVKLLTPNGAHFGEKAVSAREF